MEYHKTKDILHVMKLLGHKAINSTLLYTQLVNLEGDECDAKVAETRDEITELLEAGFEWVGQDQWLDMLSKEKVKNRCGFLQNVPRFRGFRSAVF
jgi:hypothetical protein